MWDINTKPHSSKKLGVDPFLVHFWTKNCKKTADFQVAKKICLTVIFYFIAKIHYFRPFLQPDFLKARHFVIKGWGNLKTLVCAHPLSPIMKKKIFQKPFFLDSNPCPHLANCASCTLPTEPPTQSIWVAVKIHLKENFCFCRFLRGLTSFILRFFQRIMLNHVPTFSTCWIFSICL